jgi:hypothetical protein
MSTKGIKLDHATVMAMRGSKNSKWMAVREIHIFYGNEGIGMDFSGNEGILS